MFYGNNYSQDYDDITIEADMLQKRLGSRNWDV